MSIECVYCSMCVLRRVINISEFPWSLVALSENMLFTCACVAEKFLSFASMDMYCT